MVSELSIWPCAQKNKAKDATIKVADSYKYKSIYSILCLGDVCRSKDDQPNCWRAHFGFKSVWKYHALFVTSLYINRSIAIKNDDFCMLKEIDLLANCTYNNLVYRVF